MDTYSRWEDVPDTLKTKTSLKKMGLKLARGQKPVAVKTHWDYKIPDYQLYTVTDAVPNIVTDAQREAIAKAQEKSLEKRTCTRCGFVEDLSKPYRNKRYVSNGLCEYCHEQDKRAGDINEAVEWARGILQRTDVLILDSETTDLDGEIIELAIVNLQGETVYNGRFNPITPVSAGAQAIHGITTDMLVDAPFFIEDYETICNHLKGAGLVLIYNAAFDNARIRTTCKLQGLNPPKYNSDCIMEWYAQFYNDWSEYHGSYRWQPLGGGHDALGDCLAALATIKEMARVETTATEAAADGGGRA
jgi:DNA polymerase-3 subunit epsilon